MERNLFWGDEVCKAEVELIRRLFHLLTKEMEPGQRPGPGFVGVKLDIIAYGIGGEKAVYAACRDQALLDDDIEESIPFREDLARLYAKLCECLEHGFLFEPSSSS